MRMPLKILSENQISNQFPHILESISLIIFQLKPALLFHASNLLYFLLKKKKINLAAINHERKENSSYLSQSSWNYFNFVHPVLHICLVRCEENSWINYQSRADLWFMRLEQNMGKSANDRISSGRKSDFISSSPFDC